MLKVYAIPVSLYCAKLRILLRHKSLKWEEYLPPGGYGSEEYKTIVPSGNLPVLMDGDVQLADSEAIAEYLNEKSSEPAMLPVDLVPRAKIRELSRFHDTRLEPAVRSLFPHILPAARNRTIVTDVFAGVSEQLHQPARLVERHGNELMLCDCGFPITFTWIDALSRLFDQQTEWPSAVPVYRKRVVSHGAVTDELAEFEPRRVAGRSYN